MKSSDTNTAFRVLGIRSISVNALRRSFFTVLWELLGVPPPESLKNLIAWLDDDVLGIGMGLGMIYVDDVPMTPASGHIDLLVDDLDAAARSFLTRGFVIRDDGQPSAGLRCPGFNIHTSRIMGEHKVNIRITQASSDHITAFTS